MEQWKQRSKIWTELCERGAQAQACVSQISQEVGVHPLTARVLYNRGCHSPAQAKAFLQMSDEKMHDPFLLCDIEKAVARIRRAVEHKERIAIYGDYDVDGVT